ncbi:hypothetical protein BJ138DRAFT_1138567 [Hygrophoropsis aurantiaca]|uniref:Uncharacterized protein n=1 Tax=Hygrophoropsis aurantiaca TaxID=72124 RepID=A0ACB7ZU96_9AGAM|nr:hypothetical protein BJ138DRAFT_1138567 [Hygrophoropsis aurantiaca]
MCLVIWITIFVKFILDLKVYMDDAFSFNEEDDFTYYPPYDTYYPTKQTKLLLLWDELGIPHDKAKQIWGCRIEIIGFIVDPNHMSVEFRQEKRDLLVHNLREFTVHRQRWTLREYLRIVGWCNWSFNVFPLLRPGLSALYQKTRGKKKMFAPIQVNNLMVYELSWLASHLQSAPGILLLDSLQWNPFNDDCFKIYASGSLASTSDSNVLSLKKLLEALTICSAIRACVSLLTFAVDIVQSLKADSPHNQILICSVDNILAHNIDFRVLHVAGVDNDVADALSRLDNIRAEVLSPDIQINSFTPPREVLGHSR